jgi:DNA-binding transcriptional LysR family regulator
MLKLNSMIHPDYLRTFLALVETRHFTRAARDLHMTQPGVSQHLRKLEDYYGTPLVLREGKSFRLTDAGRALEAYARKLLTEHASFAQKLRTDDPFQGRCRITSPGSFSFRIFDVLLDLAAQHPGLDPHLMVAPNHDIPRLLFEERVDVGYTTREPTEPGLESRKFATEQLMLALPRRFKSPPTAEALLAMGFVDHPDGQAYASRLLGANYGPAFRDMRQVHARVFINQFNRILDPVARGLGFTVLPEHVGRRHSAGDVRLFGLDRPVSDVIYRVQRRGDPLPLRYATIDRAISSPAGSGGRRAATDKQNK